MIQAFEGKNPDIKVKLLDRSHRAVGRSSRSRSRSETPDVVRIVGFAIAEYAATGNLVQLDDMLRQDGLADDDWLLPLSSAQVDGKLFSLASGLPHPNSLLSQGRSFRKPV